MDTIHAWCSYVLVYVKARTILFEAGLSLNLELRVQLELLASEFRGSRLSPYPSSVMLAKHLCL